MSTMDQTSATSQSRPAEPVLASTLVNDEDLNDLLVPRKRSDSISTGIKSLDDALNGGLESGRLVAISGEAGELCRTLLVSSMLKHGKTAAAVIDSTGNFDVLGLFTLILERLKKDVDVLESMRESPGAGLEETVEGVAAKILDRLKIMRVFDFVGVREAVGEIRDGLEGREDMRSRREKMGKVMEGRGKTPTLEPKLVPKRTVVPDSEDEDEEEEEMLFDTPAPIHPPSPSPPQEPQYSSPPWPDIPSEDESLEPSPQQPQPPAPIKFLLIDSLSQTLTPLLKKDYIPANALIATFLTNLSQLSRTHALHTILANPATLPRASSPSRNPPNQLNHPQQNQPHPPPPQTQNQPIRPPSIFASNPLVPQLMSVLGRYADVHFLVSKLPRGKRDARVFYRDLENSLGRGVKKMRGVEMVGVVEVVSERWEGGVGGWGVLEGG